MPTIYDEIQFGNDYKALTKSVEEDTAIAENEKKQLLLALENLQNVIADKTRKVGEMQNIERVIDEDSKKELMQSYEQLGKTIVDCRKTVQNPSASWELMDKLEKASQSELFALQNYDPKVSFQTLNSIFESNKILHVDLSGQQTDVATGQQSTRIPFVYTMTDGTVYNGFFTEQSKLDLLDEFRTKSEEIATKYGDAGKTLNAVFEDLYTAEKENPQNATFDENTLQRRVIQKLMVTEKLDTFLLKKMIDKGKDRYYYQVKNPNTKKVTTIGEPGEGKINIAFNQDVQSAVIDYRKIFTGLAGRMSLHKMAGIDESSRIDSRNAALSTIAGFMGKSSIVAKSIPMTITIGGKTVHGTFMATAKGVDVNSSKTMDKNTYKSINVDKSNGLASMSDLQALDYICGNIDRHGANFLYQFDSWSVDSKCTNVVGIDNDLSFGTFVEREYKDGKICDSYVKNGEIVVKETENLDIDVSDLKRGMNRMQHPDTMGTITKSMAERILTMTETGIRQTLAPFGLSDDQILACWKRTEIFQNRVKSAVEVPANTKQNRFEKGKLYIIQDEDFAKYSANELKRASVEATPIYAFTQLLNQQYLAKDRTIAHVAKSEYGFDAIAMRNRAVDANAILYTMQEKTKDGKTSKEFENLRQAVTAYKDFCNDHSGEMLFEQDVYRHDALIVDIQKKAKAYQKHHNSKIFKSDYANDRKAYVDTILTYAKEKQILTKDEVKNKELLSVVRENEEKKIQALNSEVKAKAMQVVLYGALEASIQKMESSCKEYREMNFRGQIKIDEIKPKVKALHDAIAENLMVKQFMKEYGEGKLTLNNADIALNAIKKMGTQEKLEEFKKESKEYNNLIKEGDNKIEDYITRERNEYTDKLHAILGTKATPKAEEPKKEAPKKEEKKKKETKQVKKETKKPIRRKHNGFFD